MYRAPSMDAIRKANSLASSANLLSDATKSRSVVLPHTVWGQRGDVTSSETGTAYFLRLKLKSNAQVNLVTGNIHVGSQNPLKIAARASSTNASSHTYGRVRISLIWLDRNGAVVSQNGSEWAPVSSTKGVVLEYVDAPRTSSYWFKVQLSIQGVSNQKFEIEIPKTIEILDSFDDPFIRQAFVIGDDLRLQFFTGYGRETESQIQISSLMDALLRGRLTPHDAVTALTNAELIPGSRQWPSYFVHLLAVVPFNDVRIAFVVMLTVALIATIVVFRTNSISAAKILPILPAFGFAIWRGNIAWILAALLLVIWLRGLQEHRGNSIPLLMSAAIKPTILMFSLLYLGQRRYARFVWTIIGFCTLQLLSGFVFLDSVAEIGSLVSLTFRPTVTPNNFNLRLGVRHDVFSLLIGFGRYVLGLEPAWLLDENLVSGILILGMLTVVLVCLISLLLGRSKCINDRSDGSLALLIAATALFFSPPGFYYSLIIIGVIPLVYEFTTYIKAMIYAAVLPLFIPLPLSTAFSPGSKIENSFDWSQQPASWTHWSLAALVSSVALMFLLIDRSRFLLMRIVSEKRSDSHARQN